MTWHRFRPVVPAVLAAAGFAAAWLLLSSRTGEAGGAGPFVSGRITWEQAHPHRGDWGELRAYFNGESHGTRNVLTAITVLKPGQAVHPAHRHAEEEYMYLIEGKGRWHLDGKEFDAAKGDMVYAAPWIMHGLTNTGDAPLTFIVVKWDNKGVEAPPKPPGDDGK